jgi:hypothetical protein
VARITGFAGGAFINVDQDGTSPPVFQGTIPDIFQRRDTGSHQYNLGAYFIGADSYSISPAVETGWSFDTNTGVLTIDTDAIGLFGPFTVTATNAFGDTPSNAFDVEVAVKNTGAGRPKRPRRRLLVEINGQDIEVSSEDEARVLLEQARKIAERAIEKARTAPVRVSRGIQRPRITTSAPELRQVVAEARRDIVDLFDGLSRDLEIASLMRKRMEEQERAEEEALIRFLM